MMASLPTLPHKPIPSSTNLATLPRVPSLPSPALTQHARLLDALAAISRTQPSRRPLGEVLRASISSFKRGVKRLLWLEPLPPAIPAQPTGPGLAGLLRFLRQRVKQQDSSAKPAATLLPLSAPTESPMPKMLPNLGPPLQIPVTISETLSDSGLPLSSTVPREAAAIPRKN